MPADPPMSTNYNAQSVGSYIQAMQSMVDASLTMKLDSFPLRPAESESTPLYDDLDTIFAQFEDISLPNVISAPTVALSLFDEVKQEVSRIAETSHWSENELLDNIIQACSTEEAESLLFDFLGYDEFELISKILQEKDLLVEQSYLSRAQAESRFLDEDGIRRQVLENQRNARNVDLLPAAKSVKYPHVFKNDVELLPGQQFTLPVGTTRESYNLYEEVIIPVTKTFKRLNEKFVPIADLDALCQGTFKGYSTLNRMQSLVYPVAYNTNENMLVCAPTGAGKTDVALLTILHTIGLYCDDEELDIEYDEFKIVYVAPLKALAAEIVEKFQKKLAWLGIQVRELTGDMQLTKAEILSTQIIVTTPEKWDVVTRKASGDNDLISKVKLLIIDEVHLLHEDRGSVIETLVARTLRQVESSQSMIRILGLSATLPNFVDVADFLGVNRNVGMFYFDQTFRPVPLEQQIIGVRGKSGSKQARENIDKLSYQKLIEMLEQGHQVMVFVHSRKDTVKTSRTFISMAGHEHQLDLLDCTSNESHVRFTRDMAKLKIDKDVKELFKSGFGIHHAGMSRSDRNLSEKMFLNGAIKVLVCTATLAWGVNLPAAAVIIKGTQVYDSKKGGFQDLGISDVLQIFGRAGRPQFEQNGIGILCTASDRLDHYLSLLTQQHPIESKLSAKLVDNLNAEISLGTVTNVDEGIQWLGYTYMFVRMKQNPFGYGIEWRELSEDPQLYDKRREMITNAARRLHALQMIVFDESSMSFIAKDLGRISSDFYLLNQSVEIFNQISQPNATEADVLMMISMSSEFDSIKFREDEAIELKGLSDHVECQVGGQIESAAGKTNVLLQSFISRMNIRDSALNSDSNYIAQNAVRICRALFLIGINRRWATFSKVMLSICKSIEKRLWFFSHPLMQFDLPINIMQQINSKHSSLDSLLDMEAKELGDLVHNNKYGSILYKLLGRFPQINVDAEVFPITTNVMRCHVVLQPDFIWDDRVHGMAQFFWVFVEESNDNKLLHFEKFILNKRQLNNLHELDFMIPLQDPLPEQIIVRVMSDTWIGSETIHGISFQHLIKPHNETLQTKLLKLQPLPTTALHNKLVESLYKFKYFNPMQTMTFHSLYNSNDSVFVGSPTGSGKTIVAELAMWHAFRDFPGSKIVYIAPMKALVRERVDDWRKKITPHTGDRVVELTGDSITDSKEIYNSSIIITTPEKFDGISRNWQQRKFVQDVSLVIMDEIHLLASDRGPILEMIVSRMNYIASRTKKPIRLLGLSTAVSNAFDMAGWLGVKDGLYNYPSSVRPVPLQMYIDGFPDNLAFCPLMKTMNKPAFMAIKQHSPDKPVLIFVASRRQTRLTALDLIHLCGMEDNPRRFLKMDDDELQYQLTLVKDETLKLSLQFGIGLHHAGLVESDRQISHKLFEANKIQILVATSTLAWGVNLPAHLVIIKGTQFFDAKIEGYRDMDLTDILQMMGRAGRPGFDTSGTAIVYTKESKKAFYKHFINVGFPVESSLHKVLDDHLGAEISSGTITSRQDAMNFLNWTFLFRRAHNNPTYYGIEDTTTAGVSQYLSDLIDTTLDRLQESSCVRVTGDSVLATPFLTISSYYYLSHLTIRSLLAEIYPDASMGELIKWLAQAKEFSELPVRNGEVIMNMEMSQQSRYSAEDVFEGVEMWDPHLKTFLLLQAFMSRVDLPIADYVQDTVSVLDQSLRILQAYIDVASELGFFHTVMKLIKFMQCLKQGCWFDDDMVSTLPGCSLKRGKSKWSLHELATMPFKKLKAVADSLRVGKDFINTVQHLPALSYKVEQHSSNKLSVSMHHENPHLPDFKMYCSRFPKTQKESWFVIVHDGSELYTVKRCSPRVSSKAKASFRCDLVVPEEAFGRTLNVTIVNDALDLEYTIQREFM